MNTDASEAGGQVPSPTLSGDADEQLARRLLWRNRTLATGLVGGMAAVFLGTHFVPNPGFLVLLLRGASEAGVVGGLADWFAITAFFRHPLGIPIPHTAILPSSKDRIARTLGYFIERNFLTPENLAAKLREVNVGKRIADWLGKPTSASTVADTVVNSLPHLLRSLQSRDLISFANRTVGNQLRRADLAPALSRVLGALTTSGEADVLFDHGIALADQLIRENRSHIEKLVEERSRWWIPKSIDRRIAETLISGVLEVVQDLRQPGSEARIRFRSALAEFAASLEASPQRRDQVNAVKDRLLDHPDVQAWLASIWADLSDAILADIKAPSSSLRAGIEQVVALVGRSLAADDAMIAYLDSAAERLALYAVSWRSEVGSFFSDIIRNWDARTLSDRFEIAIGSDLQYIRMNGTIVGAVVGTLLFLGTYFLP